MKKKENREKLHTKGVASFEKSVLQKIDDKTEVEKGKSS